MYLSDTSIKRPVFATMVIIALIVLGWVSYTRLNIDLIPDINIPVATITTLYLGAGPEQVENEVAKKIEDAVNPISGVKHITSVSSEGFSYVVVEFTLETSIQQASQEVRDKVGAIRANLPRDIEAPVIQRFDISAMPVISLTISGNRSMRDLTTYTKDNIQKRLENIPGVGAVNLIGGSDREIRIEISQERLRAYGISVQTVMQALQGSNIEMPGGTVTQENKELILRTAGRVPDVASFNDIVVSTINGYSVHLKDVAVVTDDVVEPRSLARFNGTPCVDLDIIKQSGSNTVTVVDAVKKILDELYKELPKDVKINIAVDTSEFIRDSVDDVTYYSLLLGGTLAVVIIFFFLANIRSTIISALAIPTSIIATFFIMRLLGFTLNMMTLMGLSLAVGLLIDDAIVVIENIYRHMDEGEKPMVAASTATSEIGLAVMATTFSIVAVFVPVAFMSGIVGRFFYQFGMTVTAAVLVSLFIAFTLTPMLSSRFLKSEELHGKTRNPIKLFLIFWNDSFQKLNNSYRRVLSWALRHRRITIIIAIIAFFSSFYFMKFLGVTFFPDQDTGRFNVRIKAAPGSPLERSSTMTKQVESVIKRHPEIKSILTTIGGEQTSVNETTLQINMVDKEKRTIGEAEFVDNLRLELMKIPGLTFSLEKAGGMGGGEKPVEVSVRGMDQAILQSIADKVETIMANTKGTMDVESTSESGKPELRIRVDRDKVNDLDLSIAQIASSVRSLIAGDVVTKYREGDKEYDVRVQLRSEDRRDIPDISNINLISFKKDSNGNDIMVPLSDVASIVEDTGPTNIRRYDRQREIRISSNLSGRLLGDVQKDIAQQTKKIPLPPGYSIGATGEAEMQTESFASIFTALAMAVIFVYLLLASQFESFIDPLAIMLSLPMAIIGAILGLILTGGSLSVISLIGIILLMGLVTKNAILLVDYTKTLRRRGLSRYDALLRAGPTRLRPILMTTLAMIFGMIPLALGIGAGGEFRSPMARAVIGGLITSTMLTLIVVPVVYTILDDITEKLRKRFGAKEAPEIPKAEEKESVLVGSQGSS